MKALKDAVETYVQYMVEERWKTVPNCAYN
jgi:hypothetical protein